MNEELLREQFESALGIKAESLEIIPLHAHASYRSYYRVVLPDASHYVVMEIPEGKWSVSEEISNRNVQTSELPFLNIARYLNEKGLPVPRVLSADAEKGLIILDDLGDCRLEDEIRQKPQEDKLKLYQKAITLLVDLQNRAVPDKDACIAFERSFDEELLMWEFQHFFEYGIEKRQQKKIQKTDLSYFEKAAGEITQALIDAPQVFVHRDYQSRNLMWHQDQFYIIDFQDALLGPVTYDLVALLRDSYVVLDRRMRESLFDEYLQQNQTRYQKTIDREKFAQLFDKTTIQRKLKDAGRFVYIDQVKQNPDFLPFIADSLSYVREAFRRQPELSEFYERLKPYVPEWQQIT